MIYDTSTNVDDSNTVEIIVGPAEEEDLPILWLGPAEYVPEWPQLTKQRGREAPRPSVPPP